MIRQQIRSIQRSAICSQCHIDPNFSFACASEKWRHAGEQARGNLALIKLFIGCSRKSRRTRPDVFFNWKLEKWHFFEISALETCPECIDTCSPAPYISIWSAIMGDTNIDKINVVLANNFTPSNQGKLFNRASFWCPPTPVQLHGCFTKWVKIKTGVRSRSGVERQNHVFSWGWACSRNSKMRKITSRKVPKPEDILQFFSRTHYGGTCSLDTKKNQDSKPSSMWMERKYL